MLKEKTSDVSMTNTNQGSGTAAEAAVPMSHGLWNTWRKNLLLFCLTGVYVELCLHLCVFGSMDRYAGYPVLFGLLGGALCTLVVSSLPKVLRQITGLLLVAAQVMLAEVQLVYHCIFGDFMPVSQIGMGGNVIVNFNSQLLYGIRQNLLKILLLLLPLVVVILCLALRRVQALRFRLRWKQAMASFAVLLALLLTVTGLMYVGRDKAFSAYRTFTNVNTSTDSSYKKIGMLATTAQELRYMLFSGSGSIMITPSSLNISDVPRTYSSNSYNVIESIDFTALADSTDSDILKATDEYLSNATPTRKNNYTGLLKDYNLITICAESFCPWFISEELTPTLYKLSHTGILFENYYGTFQSVTTNGEYTMCMGLYPDMSRTKTDSSFNVAGTNYLPFCLGNALKGMGYQAWGYHDYIGDFYNRNITHANMGYTFKTADSGLAMKIDWPSSDLEMMEASVDDYINSGEPFHAYYMTFSGHYQYNWDNAMSAKNRDAVKDLPYSEPVKAYIACNLELEYALEYLMQRLEQAGVADKTCIVLTNDHYPYGLTEDEYNELAGQTLDTTFEKYRNSFICYVPGLSENIVVDEYCSTADILPTLLNLFGVDYDSRLLAGTDVLSSGLHVAVLSDKSFLTKVYGDNVFEKDGIRRDRTGDGEKTRCLCGKRGIFNRDGPAMGPQIIRQLERGASRRSASFFHALASPGRPRNGGGASGAYQPAEGRKALIQGRFRAQEGPLGPSRKSQQQTKRTGFAALEDSIADEAPEGKRAKRANRALNRAGINSRGQKQGFGGADRRAGRVTSR